MTDKLQTQITGVTLNTPTYHNVTFHPTLINFFYGNNGSGKSTLARTVGLPAASSFAADVLPDQTDVLLYNEDYIEKNIRNYGGIPGVFTISKINAEIQQTVDDVKIQQQGTGKELKKLIQLKSDALASLSGAEQKCIEDVWIKTESIRTQYTESLFHFPHSRKDFMNLLDSTAPEQIDREELDDLYHNAFAQKENRFEPYFPADADFPSCSLLSEPVFSSASSPYAAFLHSLNAVSWVQEGHQKYHEKAGVFCPYCSQKLPERFEQDLASCFDEQYRNSITELTVFLDRYGNELNRLQTLLQKNCDNGFSCEETDAYKAASSLFIETEKNNLRLIRDKLKDPVLPVSLSDCSGILARINALAVQINEKIAAHNWTFDHQKEAQKRCVDAVWGHMASLCQSDLLLWDTKREEFKQILTNYEISIAALTQQVTGFDDRISDLNSQTVNTDQAMHNINTLLKTSGFTGFALRKKPGSDLLYELVRPGAEGAYNVVEGKALSEGERHFIAFLYFYQEVIGSPSSTGEERSKIVVIDDPVSSLDSSTVFVVAALTRKIIDICYNNYRLSDTPQTNYVRQLFCLTHNPAFFREVIYNRISDYECVNLYEIKKDAGNSSSVMLCVKDSGETGGRKINFSPIRNGYDMLWEEYSTCSDPVQLMHVIRQIIEHFFLQTLGCQGDQLREELCEHTGLNDSEQTVVAAMLNLVNTSASGFYDSLYFDASAVEPSTLRLVFRKIFEITGQEKYYEKMVSTH